MSDEKDKIPAPSTPIYRRGEAHLVMKEIATHMKISSKAWVGLGEGRILMLKDDAKGLTTYYEYEDGVFTFHDGKGGSQVVEIERITEIAGF